MPWQTQLRADARAIFAAGVDAVEPRLLVRRHLESDALVEPDGRVWIVSVGKAAVAMAGAALEVLTRKVAGGVLIASPGGAGDAPAELEVFEGGHPIPNREGVRGAERIRDLACGLAESDTLLCLISGGGSALMTLPPEGVPLADVQATTESLLRAGATIDELNRVRKHLDQLKGGRLAALASPARVEALILSDVVGDPLDVIASGPVSPDPTTFEDAWRVLTRRAVMDSLPGSVRRHLEEGRAGGAPESPKAGDACFENVSAAIVGSNRIAAAAAIEAARARGYAAWLLSTEAVGEASRVGRELAALGKALRTDTPVCLVAAGETTVTVTGGGRGGRNQELALGAALELDGTDRVLVASMGTDGIDGPTDAAGAMADGATVSRAAALGLDLRQRLADNDAYSAFAPLDDLIVTGPTGTNVMDLMSVLVAGE